MAWDVLGQQSAKAGCIWNPTAVSVFSRLEAWWSSALSCARISEHNSLWPLEIIYYIFL